MPIRLLAPDVADKIAAGEVVERPASVAKEPIESLTSTYDTALHAIEARPRPASRAPAIVLIAERSGSPAWRRAKITFRDQNQLRDAVDSN